MRNINLWPLGIALFVMIVIGMIVITVTMALKNPVQTENSFLGDYQEIDDSINELQEEQQYFLAHYEIVWLKQNTQEYQFQNSRGQQNAAIFQGRSFLEGLCFEIRPKDGSQFLENISIQALLTRPHTKEFDVPLLFTGNNNVFCSESFQLPSFGRWIIRGIITYDQGTKKSYFKYNFFVKE